MKRLSFALGLVAVGIAIPASVGALTPLYEDTLASAQSAFRSYADVSVPHIQVPTVVEVPLEGMELDYSVFLVEDLTNNVPEPYQFVQETYKNPTPISIATQGWYAHTIGNLVDGNPATSIEFPFDGSETSNTTTFTISSDRPFTASGVAFRLAEYSSLPERVSIASIHDGVSKTLIADRPLEAATVRFPSFTMRELTVTLTYSQPIQFTEVVLLEEGMEVTQAQVLRFLAQPGHIYRVYFDADRSISLPSRKETGNLWNDEGVYRLPSISVISNLAYTEADVDGDTIPDKRDNCPHVSNVDQRDVDNSGYGDACEDFDRDYVFNDIDNCPNDPNYDQGDVDGDGIGDVCDPQESRLTERFPWIPWVGMGGAALVLVILFAMTASMGRREDTDPTNTPFKNDSA
jgi:hypothetical protein